MKTFKRYLPDVGVIVLFLVISLAYFFPADFEGRILFQHDAGADKGFAHELSTFKEQTGETSRWASSLFSGMPTYQLSPSYASTQITSTLRHIYELFLPGYAKYLFAYLIGFYILMRAFDVRRSLAVLGSIIWAFSSYFLIIIAAGHLWKVMALSYLPPMIAGVVWAYRGHLLRGFVVTTLFTAFEVSANHPQMTYYYLFIILFLVIAYGVEYGKQKRLPAFIKTSVVVAIAAVLGICVNLSNLYHTWQYSKESMRGKSELVKPDSGNQTDSGLERDYITMWSYGLSETWSLLVPNVKGGASDIAMDQNSITQEKGDLQFMQIYQQMGQYWGTQPGTSGPVYVGAFVLMLFVLGIFIVKGPVKWALLAATVLSILLAWGKNFMGFTDFFIDYIPMYSKFRTVSSILVIAEFTIPLLAILALKRIVEEPRLLRTRWKALVASFLLTGGVSLVFALMPTLFFSEFVSPNEQVALSQALGEWYNPFIANLVAVRQAIFVSDAWRSFFIILLGTAFLVVFLYGKIKPTYLAALLTVLCLVDMWQVNKRYLHDEMFVEASVRDTPVTMTDADKFILKDKEQDYRVLNMASNTFNENNTSYFHKSIGGYHAAKLRRYQELIEAYIAPEMEKLKDAVVKANGDMTQVAGDSIYPVLNMLNTKYFIFGLANGQTVPLRNLYNNGSAWFLDKIQYVDNANAELDGMKKINLRREAVADKRFKDALGEVTTPDGEHSVKLTTYQPNRLTYEVNTDKDGILTFSEIYYPGWKALIDGNEVPVGRVNYVLRAIRVPAGKHQIVLDFHPTSISVTETIAYAVYALLALILIVLVFVTYIKPRIKQ